MLGIGDWKLTTFEQTYTHRQKIVGWENVPQISSLEILLMEEILHQLACIKP